ncbi:IclR family transcriptional regulator domain-containing protein [Brachybacterium muris]|uniref:IclR family transcriptional regulator domain-containing protein n=1 Tax=Brachybacterium muris TaxID=219301 RepID=UPI003B8A9859
MARFTPATTVDPAALERQFEQVRRQGFAVSTGEYDVGVSTVAVVVSLRGSLSAASAWVGTRPCWTMSRSWGASLIRRAANSSASWWGVGGEQPIPLSRRTHVHDSGTSGRLGDRFWTYVRFQGPLQRCSHSSPPHISPAFDP